ncbi:hypothetical protein [Mucilaginibacter gotjawali]|uniref:Uncharacterized protein n=2 Tax=Mucilaginibacter gotjawali TaxID=1550579 RepID=A0A0X8X305_9SPHI|nr:hypothetical protein [Mucilaginibacter gotjawali]MBB3055873.1 hypothetical protein [Mucilaginibacter gotjawali]BAU54695.1 hypothetical protein MgSA37_02873 [Mucilaginibacter gotjawali]
MKIKFNTSKILLVTVVTAGIAFMVTSCHKDASTTSTNATVTEADAVQLTTDAVSPSTGGMVLQLNSSVNTYATVNFSCGVQKDSSYVIASSTGASPSYNYSFQWNDMLTCNGTAPSQLTFNFTGTGSYTGPLMSSTDNSTGGFVLTGLGAGSQYLFNTTYSRTGTTTSKVLRQLTFHSVITITGTDIAIDKTTKMIASGTAAVSISATSTSGSTFTFNGKITFRGNKKANLVLNSGVTYVIQWN